MNILDAIEQLKRLKDEHGDVYVAYEAFDDGPESSTVVRLKPLSIKGAGEAEISQGQQGPCLFLDLLETGPYMPMSDMIDQLNDAYARYGDVLIAMDDDYGYLNNGVRLHFINCMEDLGPFFEDDVIDIARSQLPCVIFSAYSVC